MKDVYLQNNETGELLPSSTVIQEFYKNHDVLEDWHTEWSETGIETKDDIDAPDFSKVLNL